MAIRLSRVLMRNLNNVFFLLIGSLQTDARVKRHAVSLSKVKALQVSCLHYLNHEEKTIFLTTFEAGKIVNTRKIIQPFHNSLAPIFYHATAFYFLIMRRYLIVLGNDIHTCLIIYICSLFRHGNIYDTHEIWPELVRQKLPRIISNMLIILERQVIKRSDLVIFPSKLRKKFISRYYRIHLKNHYISENLPSNLVREYEFFNKSIDVEEIKVKKKTVVYTGVIAPDRGIENLLTEFKKLDDSWHLLIVGMIRNIDLHTMIVDCDLEQRVTYLGTIESERLRPLIRNCQVGFVHYCPDSVNNQLFASNKVWEYLIESVPVVINDLIASKSMTENVGVFKYFNGEIHNAIENAFHFQKSRIDFDTPSWEERCSDFNQRILSIVKTLDKDF